MNNQFYDSLKNNNLFKNTDLASLNLDEVKGRLVRVGEGEVVFREGAPSDFIYLIVTGRINIIKKKMLGKAKSYLFGENEFFGNDEYFEETTRTSTAVALVDSYLIILAREEIESLMMQDNEIYLSLRENLSGLFDNSTEIQIDEEDAPSGVQTQDIDKIITGEEIQNGFVTASFEESSGIPDSEPSEEIIEDITLTQEDIGILEQNAQIDVESEAAETATAEENIETGTEAFIQEAESPSYEPEILPEPPVTVSDEEMIEALASIDDFEKIPLPENGIPEETGSDSFTEPVKNELIENNLTTEINLARNDAVEPDGTITDDPGGEMNKDEVTKIINAMELVNSMVKIDDLLTSIVNVACDLTNADRGTLYLVDKEKGELWSKIAMGTEPKEIRLKIGEGIAGAVARTKTIENIKDVSTHPMFKKDVDKSSGYVTKNMLCFPLKNKEDEVIGVLQLLNSKSGAFSEHDEEVLSMISINTAIALQNAELVEKLLTAERVSSLGKMTNFLIQDIKKPVLVSKRYTEHLKSKNLTPELNQLVEMILTELTQVADLVQTTSSYAEGKTILRTSLTGINSVLQDFIGRVDQFVTSRRCRINFDPDKEANVKIDSKEFFQCFQHIVKNACDAMPDGGALTIKTKIIDRTVKIIFEDQGLGIPEAIIEKIFEPFVTHGKKEGSGLGLSITRKVVEAHQGTIEVRSSLGAGAVFTVTLPLG